MKAIFSNSQEVETEAKKRYKFPPFIMMENAAAAMEEAVKKLPAPQKVLIVCGSGNNGGDGYALARRLCGKIECLVVAQKNPKTEEAIVQRQMAEATGVTIITEEEFWKLGGTGELEKFNVIVDCLLGTGFTGELRPNIEKIIEKLNTLDAYKIACDIPTGLKFHAHETITMGCLKTTLFSDYAKAVCGKITVADLGMQRNRFEDCGTPSAFLIEQDDIKLPFRKNKAAHKGNFGHTAVFAGEKSGAGILAASAALNFGSGLVTLVKTTQSNLEQFKISPELMILDSIPANTTCILIGSGLGKESDSVEKALSAFTDWFTTAKNPACVLDADLFSYPGLPSLLKKLNAVPSAKIILTPHLKELQKLYESIFPEENITVKELSQAEKRIEIGKKITTQLPAVTVIMKSANTFIASAEEGVQKIYICNVGCQSLAKAGSGDVLAGMAASLLAQGYTVTDAAITTVYTHGAASQSFSQGEGFNLSPEKLINAVCSLSL